MSINKKIIERLQYKEEEAFNIIYNEYYKLVYSVIYNIVMDKEISEQLMIDSFHKMYQNIHSLKKIEVTSFKYWLLQIAKNLSIDYLKSNKNKHVILNNDIINEVIEPTKSDNYYEIIDFIFKNLDSEDCEIVNYRLICGLRFKEIALLIDSKTNIVSNRYYKAIKKIKNDIRGMYNYV